MGQCGIGAGRHDGLEGNLFAPLAANSVIQFQGELPLPDPRPDHPAHLGQGLARDPGGPRADAGHLLGVFHGAEIAEALGQGVQHDPG
jgi:hypothetical protein